MNVAFAFVVAAFATAVLPAELPVVEDTVDLVELNTFYDVQGKVVFDQLIFYEWSNITGDYRYNVIDFRMMKHGEQHPRRDWNGGGYLTTWHDNEVLRTIRSHAFRQTWTQFDPEVAEREVQAKEDRPGLRPAKVTARKLFTRDLPAAAP